jgi:hypothetical protein
VYGTVTTWVEALESRAVRVAVPTPSPTPWFAVVKATVGSSSCVAVAEKVTDPAPTAEAV